MMWPDADRVSRLLALIFTGTPVAMISTAVLAMLVATRCEAVRDERKKLADRLHRAARQAKRAKRTDSSRDLQKLADDLEAIA